MTPHELATGLSKDFFRKAVDSGLNFGQALTAIEGFLAVSLMFVVNQDDEVINKQICATALLDAMTENAAKTINEIYLEKAE